MGSGALRQGEHHIHRLLGFTNSSNNPSRASAEKRCELMQTFHEREAVIGEDSVLGMKNELITHYVLLPKYCILTLPTAMWKNHFFVRQLLGNIGVLLIYGDFGYVSPNDATYPVLITCCLNFQVFQLLKCSTDMSDSFCIQHSRWDQCLWNRAGDGKEMI
ncbi:uncharacterized protein LOC112531050 isoform X2 [Gallus gallus]|uniref:uncharacterized protein LOC112531050 isoform X2 n=1 Tax=Gallus gallus TaxID=9031 RepID=UPI001AE171AF|nr:uncharacterized protein LOC112531050 isoform X2 [Gallus gallus]